MMMVSKSYLYELNAITFIQTVSNKIQEQIINQNRYMVYYR